MTYGRLILTTAVCDRCIHHTATALNQQCAKGHGGLHRLSLSPGSKCRDFQRCPINHNPQRSMAHEKE